MKRLEKKKSDFRKTLNGERLFVAIQPPIEVRREILQNHQIFGSDERNFRFINPEQLHITIKFLGSDVSLDSKEQIIKEIQNILPQIESPTIIFEGLQFGFSKQMIPRIMFYNIKATPELQLLNRLVHEHIKDLELEDVKREKDYKKVVYHLSVARTKHNSNKTFGRNINKLIKEKAKPITIQFTPEKIYLIKSKLHHASDPRYEVIAQFDFNRKKKEDVKN